MGHYEPGWNNISPDRESLEVVGMCRYDARWLGESEEAGTGSLGIIL